MEQPVELVGIVGAMRDYCYFTKRVQREQMVTVGMVWHIALLSLI